MSRTDEITGGLKYRPPFLSEGKQWYITYYAFHPPTSKLKRIQIRLNHIKKIGPRRAYARALINQITEKLVSGWNPFIEASAPKAFYKMLDVIETYWNIQQKEAEDHSLRTYKSFLKFFKEYLSRKKFSKDLFVIHFGKREATDMMVELKQKPDISLRTYNNYLQFFTTLFNWMVQYNYVAENPFADLKKVPKKKIKKIRTTLTAAQRSQLVKFLEENDKNNYLVMCLMCYYCFIRPNEISLLKVKDIDLENQTIYISKDIAKNDTDSYRTIPNTMMPYLRKLKLDCPPDYYLFSMDKHQEFVPGKKRAEGREIARYWSDVIRPKLNWPMNLQFYSLKDTGITNMLVDGVAPNFVQGQADHSSLSITSIYAEKRNVVGQKEIRTLTSDF